MEMMALAEAARESNSKLVSLRRKSQIVIDLGFFLFFFKKYFENTNSHVMMSLKNTNSQNELG